MKASICPCGSSKSYDHCCQKAHNHPSSASTAQALMRSRYSAFALGMGDYLQTSHAKKTRPSAKEGKEIERWAKSVTWVKLEIHHCTNGSSTDENGTVEFTAFYLENGTLQSIHENSYFERRNQRWYYVGYA